MSTDLERSQLDELGARWIRAWGDGHGFEGSATGDIAYEDPISRVPLEGIDALTVHVRRLHEAFPDVRIERTAPPLERGGHACIPWRLTGTNKGDLIEGLMPATDRFVTLHGLHYAELSDGLVRRARGFLDLYDAATQLGLLPQRGGFGEAALLMLRGFGLRR